MGEGINYCLDAYKLFKREIVCSPDCPIYKTCPYIVLGDAADKNAKKLMKEMIKIANRRSDVA